MVILKFVSCINVWVFIPALCDGIYNNDAFKNTTGDENNEKWTQLLLDLKFFDELDEKDLGKEGNYLNLLIHEKNFDC